MFYCNSLHHLAPVKHQRPGFHSSVGISLNERAVPCLNIRARVSVVLPKPPFEKCCRKFLLTSTVTRSTGANVFVQGSCLFKALWDVYFTHIYCSIATHPDGKIKKKYIPAHLYQRYRPDQFQCIFFKWLSGTHLEVVCSSVAVRDDHLAPSVAKGP